MWFKNKKFEKKIFISHSEDDRILIEKIDEALRSKGCEVYVEQKEMNYGESQIDSICNAIDGSEFVLLILTGKSIESKWVNQEIGFSYALGKTIIPIVIECMKIPDEIPGMIKHVKCIDCRKKNHNATIELILGFFEEHSGFCGFSIKCERCDNEFGKCPPDPIDKDNWKNKHEPLVCKCPDCGHMNKINPVTYNRMNAED